MSGVRARLTRNVLGAGGIAAAAWILAAVGTRSSSATASVALLAFVISGLIALSILRWDWGLFAFLVWLACEDLARKFLGNNLVIYFGKDVVLASVYAGFLLRGMHRTRPQLRARFLLPLLAFAAISTAEVLNPYSPSPLYGLLGLRLYLFYSPLMFVLFALMDSERRLRAFLLVNFLLALGIAAVGILQATVDPGLLNPATAPPGLDLLRLDRQSPVSGYLLSRPSSVFVSTGRFGGYLLFIVNLGIGAVLSIEGRRIRLVAGATLTGALLATVFLGSRAGVLYGLASVVVVITTSLWQERGSARYRGTLRTLGIVTAAIGLAIVAAGLLFPDATRARWALYYETIAPWSPASELAYRARIMPAAEFLRALKGPNALLGNGIGTASLGTQYLMSRFGVAPAGVWVESGHGVIVAELGVIGLLAWLAWTLALIVGAWRAALRLRGSRLQPLAFAIAWFITLVLGPLMYGSMSSYQDFVINAYLWMSVGILFRLHRFDRGPMPLKNGPGGTNA